MLVYYQLIAGPRRNDRVMGINWQAEVPCSSSASVTNSEILQLVVACFMSHLKIYNEEVD